MFFCHSCCVFRNRTESGLHLPTDRPRRPTVAAKGGSPNSVNGPIHRGGRRSTAAQRVAVAVADQLGAASSHFFTETRDIALQPGPAATVCCWVCGGAGVRGFVGVCCFMSALGGTTARRSTRLGQFYSHLKPRGRVLNARWFCTGVTNPPPRGSGPPRVIPRTKIFSPVLCAGMNLLSIFC